jgi:hypothetical protein
MDSGETATGQTTANENPVRQSERPTGRDPYPSDPQTFSEALSGPTGGSDRIADASQTLLGLIERDGGERPQEQQAMWGEIEAAVQAVGELGIAEGRRERITDTDALTRAAYADGVGDGRPEGRRTAAAKIAEEIRRELVCCHIYDAIEAEAKGDEVAIRKIERTGHGICFWGEAGARIAEQVGRGERD